MPPMASALFWVWARNFAAELVAPGIEHVHAGTACGRAGKGIGVNGNKYVGIARAAFGDADAQGNEDLRCAS